MIAGHAKPATVGAGTTKLRETARNCESRAATCEIGALDMHPCGNAPG
jgi:hypothetical protein